MLTKYLAHVKTVLHEIEHLLFFGGSKYPPGIGFSFAETSAPLVTSGQKSFSIHDFMQDGLLWGTPTRRRSLERRHKRRYGNLEYFYKLIIPKKDLIVCLHCGHDHERGHLCKNCYDKVKAETTQMQDAIQEALGLNPIEQEVVVLYKGEKESKPSEFWEGKRIVELPKERPAWYTKNLLQRSTASTSEVADVKPDNLG